jgi:glucose-6-phosphate 1-dehydrogenase
VAERLGIEGRAAYYESTGALRDMVQNHLLQLLALVTMEPPVSIDHVALRDEKVKVLRAVAPITGEAVDRQTVRAQYKAGVAYGRPMPGYRQEEGVAPDSHTETYMALKLCIDNWRWGAVPFYMRTGKRLARQLSAVQIEFKRPAHLTFGRQATRELEPNSIVLRYFVRSDEVEAAWELIDRIERRWACGCPPLAYYPAGSWGPPEADEMLARDGRRWHQP